MTVTVMRPVSLEAWSRANKDLIDALEEEKRECVECLGSGKKECTCCGHISRCDECRCDECNGKGYEYSKKDPFELYLEYLEQDKDKAQKLGIKVMA